MRSILSGSCGLPKGRHHVDDVHDCHDRREHDGEDDESHAGGKADGHGEEHASDVLGAAGDRTEAHEVEHAHDGDADAQVAVYQRDDHLDDEWEQGKRHHEVLAVIVAKHVDESADDAKHDGGKAADEKLARGHLRRE